jgi:hypothetical protein
MGVKLVSASAGSVEIVAPTTASNYTATMPAGTGTVVVNGINSSLVSGTSVASTSGTSIDFTGIPTWVKRITVMFSTVSLNSTSAFLIQIGSGSIATTGYDAVLIIGSQSSSNTVNASVAGFPFYSGAATFALSGSMIITNITGNTWVEQGVFANSTTTPFVTSTAGTKALTGVLDRVRITTVSGTDTFDLGSVNILYE